MKLEEMSSFFNNRAEDYEQHMMDNVEGANRFYIETAKLIPKVDELNLLDLGCGTGLELDEIFKINPTVKVTGIDLSNDMLEKIKENGFYIETDYIAPNQEYEDYHFSENKRIRLELGITDGFYHYDTPCTVENQIQMLYKAGFKSVEKVWQHECTVILLAKK